MIEETAQQRVQIDGLRLQLPEEVPRPILVDGEDSNADLEGI